MPVSLVQCGHPGPEERRHSAFLRGLQASQRVNEGLISLATDSGGLEKHGWFGTFLINGFQVRLLADQDGPRIATVHGLHGEEPWVLRVYPHAVRAVQHIGDIPASHAEHPGGAEPHLLCNLPGRCYSLRSHREGAPRALARGVQEVPGVKFEA